LEMNEGHHSLRIANECNDRSRPVGVPDIEAFGAKCQDTEINQGIIVSTSGFANTARSKADHLGIRCLDIEEIESFKWLLATGINSTTTNLLSNEWIFFPMEDGVVDHEHMEIIDDDGIVVPMTVFASNAQREVSNLLKGKSEPVEEAEIVLKFPGDGLNLRNSDTGATVPVKDAVAKIRYQIKQDLVPLRLVQYQDVGADETIAEAAYADMNFGETDARVVIVNKDGEGAKVVLIPRGDKPS